MSAIVDRSKGVTVTIELDRPLNDLTPEQQRWVQAYGKAVLREATEDADMRRTALEQKAEELLAEERREQAEWRALSREDQKTVAQAYLIYGRRGNFAPPLRRSPRPCWA